MGLFFDILSAVNNPSQQANVAQLSSLTQEVQQVAGRFGLDAAATQSVISILGNQLAPALKQQSSGANPLDIAGMVGQLTGGGLPGALQSLLPPQAQQLLIQGLTPKKQG